MTGLILFRFFLHIRIFTLFFQEKNLAVGMLHLPRKVSL